MNLLRKPRAASLKGGTIRGRKNASDRLAFGVRTARGARQDRVQSFHFHFNPLPSPCVTTLNTLLGFGLAPNHFQVSLAQYSNNTCIFGTCFGDIANEGCSEAAKPNDGRRHYLQSTVNSTGLGASPTKWTSLGLKDTALLIPFTAQTFPGTPTEFTCQYRGCLAFDTRPSAIIYTPSIGPHLFSTYNPWSLAALLTCL